MSYDLKLLVIKHKAIYHPNSKLVIDVKNEVEDGFHRYLNIWPFTMSMDGIWYTLVSDDDGLLNAFAICDSDFEKNEQDIDMPYWIDDEDIKYDLTPLIIRKNFRSDFETIITEVIKTSSIGTMMILASNQSHDKEIICGIISLSEYLTLLDRGKILFNVCYVIRD